ncbi:MAG: hypothetical protein EOM90_12900 [Alphaproteobacteria bacterium]|nr:hypothetical protein [Alphaproteobacteria bacterium]
MKANLIIRRTCAIFIASAFITCMLVHVSFPVRAQYDSLVFKKFHHIWVAPVHGRTVKHGALLGVGDSSLLVTSTVRKKMLNNGNFLVSEIDSRKIQRLWVQSSKTYGMGKIIGASTGFATGITFGAIQLSRWNDQYTLETEEGKSLEDAVEGFGFILIVLASTASGILVGMVADQIAKKTILIDGDQQRFAAVKQELAPKGLLNILGDSATRLKYVKLLRDSIADFDENLYPLQAIGGMVWMEENLRTTHYSNGEPIPLVAGNEEWQKQSTGAYCNNANNTAQIRKLGRLYNRKAVLDARNICPNGWHIPTFREWHSVIKFFGGEENAGKGLRGYGTRAEFANLAGYREGDGSLARPGIKGTYWWSDHSDEEMILGLMVEKSKSVVRYIDKESGNNMGMSVRCLRDY